MTLKKHRDEIIFDDDLRREFLTGFRKRKLQRTVDKRNKRLLREKQDRLDTRREQRRILAEQAAKNAAEVEAVYGGHVINIDQTEWHGLPQQHQAMGKEQEYEDEEQLATVTVVEHFDPSDLPTPPKSHPPPDPRPKPILPTVPTHPPRIKSTSKHVHYQTKPARMAERKKQKNRKFEKATRAGGKGSRKSSTKRPRKR